MKILFISGVFPYPPNRGDKLRLYSMCKELAVQNEVKVLSLISESADTSFIKILESVGINIETVIQNRYFRKIKILASLATTYPMQIFANISFRMIKKIKETLAKDKYDVVFFYYLNMAYYIEAVSGSNAVKVIDYCDASSLYLSRLVKYQSNPVKRVLFYMDMLKTKRFEKIAERFDCVFLCSRVDIDFLLNRKIEANYQILPNGFDYSGLRKRVLKPEKNRIIFTGNMPYFPNIDAAIYFAKEIFPLVLKKIPSAKFYIVGQNPPREILCLESDNIIVTGYVENIQDEYHKSAVNVVPIRYGAGTPNKTVESLVLGLPTVSTSIAVMGMPEELKKYIYVADEPDEFASMVCTILSEERTDISENVFEEISEILSYEIIMKKQQEFIKNLVLGIKKDN